jgi:hypothetical protein
VSIGPAARALVRLGVALILVAAVAGVWETLAAQAPSSEFHVGHLPGPIGQLRLTAMILGLAMLAAAWLEPWLGAGQPPWRLVWALHVGALITIAAMVWGATTGMYGVQISDPRPESRWLFSTRAVGLTILGGCLVDVARRISTRRPDSRA